MVVSPEAMEMHPIKDVQNLDARFYYWLLAGLANSERLPPASPLFREEDRKVVVDGAEIQLGEASDKEIAPVTAVWVGVMPPVYSTFDTHINDGVTICRMRHPENFRTHIASERAVGLVLKLAGQKLMEGQEEIRALSPPRPLIALDQYRF